MTTALIDRLETRPRSIEQGKLEGPLRQRFFLAASPLVSSAFGRQNEDPRRTQEKPLVPRVRVLWYLMAFSIVLNL